MMGHPARMLRPPKVASPEREQSVQVNMAVGSKPIELVPFGEDQNHYMRGFLRLPTPILHLSNGMNLIHFWPPSKLEKI